MKKNKTKQKQKPGVLGQSRKGRKDQHFHMLQKEILISIITILGLESTQPCLLIF